MEPNGFSFEINKKCNLNCLHCYLSPEERSKDNFFDDVTVFEKILDEASLRDYLFITLTGGEVFLNKNLFKYIESARQRGFFVKIKTNGTLPTVAEIEKIASYGAVSVDVSIYSASEEEHDRITCLKGSFSATVNTAKRLRSKSIRVEMASPLLHPITNLSTLYELSVKLGLLWKPDPFIVKPFYQQKGFSDYSLNDDEMRIFIKFMIKKELYKNNGVISNGREKLVCKCGDNAFHIDSEGNFYPCLMYSKTIGNVRNLTLEEMFDRFRPEITEIHKRKACVNCTLIPYCQPCPAISLLEEGNAHLCSSQRRRFAAILKEELNQ